MVVQVEPPRICGLSLRGQFPTAPKKVSPNTGQSRENFPARRARLNGHGWLL
jgi:hypothetical protein